MTFDGMASLIRNVAQSLATPPVQSDFALSPPPQGDPMTNAADEAEQERGYLESRGRRSRAGAGQARALADRFRALAQAQTKLGEEFRSLAAATVLDDEKDSVSPAVLRRDPMKYEVQQTLSRMDHVVHDAHGRAGIWSALADHLTVQADRLAGELKEHDEAGQADG